MKPTLPTIAIAGATGFVGSALIAELNEYPIIALSRGRVLNRAQESRRAPLEWRSCDLFSLLRTEQALQGADIGIYLVHSMIPSARLNQASFSNLDLVLADNFAKACQKAGVKKIIYLGAILPENEKLSDHLKSRLEVEKTLESSQIPFLSLRAGLILGTGGSSFEMMSQLIQKLPVLICPSWTRGESRPIAIEDVCASFRYCLEHFPKKNRHYDLVGPEKISYLDLMKLTAFILNKKRFFYSFFLFSPGLSVLWIQLITGASPSLVKPLIWSLKFSMLGMQGESLVIPEHAYLTPRESIRNYVGQNKPRLKSDTKSRKRFSRTLSTVTSVQRFYLTKKTSARDVAECYFIWLKNKFSPWIQLRELTPGHHSFHLLNWKTPLLVLSEAQNRRRPDRELFYITGGLLAARNRSANSRLEFREVLGGQIILASIFDYAPSLPWYIYKFTQAKIHLWIMSSFSRWLESNKSSK